MRLASLEHLFSPQIPPQLSQFLYVSQLPEQKTWAVNVSPSKSVTNRAIVLSAMSSKPIELNGPLLADDTWWGLTALESLGFALDLSALPEKIKLYPPNRFSTRECVDLHVGQAGTLARFLPAALLNWNVSHPQAQVQQFKLTADPQMMKRPLLPLLNGLKEWGAHIPSIHWPVELRPSQLSGTCRIDGSQSGQFLSGLLLAAAGSGQHCSIERFNHLVQPDYVRITLSMLADFGIEVVHDAEFVHFSVPAQKLNPPKSYTIEADASTACYFAALACVLGRELNVLNLGSATLQPDFQFFEFLKQFFCQVSTRAQSCNVIGVSSERELPNDAPLSLDLTHCSDQAITVGVLALCTRKSVRVTGVAHIRHHESDRIASFCKNCHELGVAAVEYPDGFHVPVGIHPQKLSGVWKTHNDHRFALAGVVLAACAPNVAVENVGCMKKTAPDFIQKLSALGFQFSSSRN